MKKNFKYYALIWIILLAAFNAVIFLVRPVIPGYVINYDARFWIAWAFILAAFVGNLTCAYFASQAENLNKMFYHLPLITVSRSALIAMLVAGCVLMLIPNCPAWISAIVCILLLAFNAIAVMKAGWAADAVGKIDEKVKTQTAFVKNLTVDAEGLLARAKSDAVRAECKKVYEAVRYSDPMSSEALSEVEARVEEKFKVFEIAINTDRDVAEAAESLLQTLEERNRKCRVIK